jgi:hypothetical protein
MGTDEYKASEAILERQWGPLSVSPIIPGIDFISPVSVPIRAHPWFSVLDKYGLVWATGHRREPFMSRA